MQLFINKEIQKNRGITLIALVITIIVLLILAGISISMLAGDNGILQRTTDAKTKSDEAQIIERIQIAYMASISNELGDTTKDKFQKELDKEFGSGRVTDLADDLSTVKIDGKEYQTRITGTPKDEGESEDEVPNLLKLYVLGQDLEGQSLYNILPISSQTFLDDEDSIANASNEVKFMNILYGTDDLYSGTVYSNYYVRYNNVAYKITVEGSTTKSVEKVYEPVSGSMEGQVVYYSVNGTDPETGWIVLYDNGDTVDIMSIATIGSLTLGSEDPEEAESSYWDVERARNSYNNSVTRINNYCASLITNSKVVTQDGKKYVRSIGSKPDFSTTDTTETYSKGDYGSSVLDGVGKVGDLNAEQDVIRMSYYYPGNSYEPGRICC